LGIALGLAGAIFWGFADFSARFASRRIGAYRTLFFMQIFGFLLITPYLKFTRAFHGAAPGWQPWLLAIGAGVINAAASLALYRSFEVGVMTNVAPVSSCYPALTAALAFWSGERIGPVRCAGLVVTFAGVLLAAMTFHAQNDSAEISPSPDAHSPASSSAAGSQQIPGAPRPRLATGVGWAVLAALGFGFMFWFLGFYVIPQVGAGMSVWFMRITAVVALLLVAAPARQSLRLPGGNVWWLLLVVGAADTAAFVANNTGLRIGPVSIVSVLASLYGAVTVVLSWIFLRERLARSQWVGILFIFAGIVLVSL